MVTESTCVTLYFRIFHTFILDHCQNVSSSNSLAPNVLSSLSQYCRTTASIWRSWSPTCAPSRTATSPCTTGCAQTNWPAVEASSTCAPRRGESKGSKFGQIPASSQLYLIFSHFHLYFSLMFCKLHSVCFIRDSL